MRRIACVGSSPAISAFAAAVTLGPVRPEALTIFWRPASDPVLPGFAVSDKRLRALCRRLEVGAAALPVKRWRWTEVFHRSACTVIDGELGGAVDRVPFAGALERLALERGCAIGDDVADLDQELSAFDLIVVDAADLPIESFFQSDVADWRTFSACLSVSHLAADRVLEVVEKDGAIFFGHGFVVSEGQAAFFVEAKGDAWSRHNLTDASSDAIAAFVRAVFFRSLDGAGITSCSRPVRVRTATPQQWRNGNRVLLGGSAVAAHPSFLHRSELALDDAMALASAISADRPLEQSLGSYENSRRALAASAARASDLEMSWLDNLHRYVDLPPATFAFNALTRSLRVNHRDLEKAAPAFTETVDRQFAAIPEGANEAVPPPMFVPLTLRGLTLPNRIGVSPMCMYQAEDGTVNDFHLVHLGSRAMGGAGLIFSEMTNVSPEGRISFGCAGMYKPEHVPAWKHVVDYVHRHSPAKIAIQLAHAGRRASTALPWEGRNVPPPQGGWETLAPSAIPFCDTLPAPREMTRFDIARLVADFERAARWSVEAGFDMIELHMAHGYLFSTFLSPLSNKRTDEFGGNLQGRARFPLEAVRAVRAACPEKPLSVRISAVDWSPGGSTIGQMIEFSAMLKEAGVDIVDVSTGNVIPTRRPTTGRLFQTPFSDQIRNEVKIPTMTVGQIKSYGDINAILAAGRADVCLLAKGHLRMPYFTHEAATAQGYDLPWHPSYRGAEEFRLRDES